MAWLVARFLVRHVMLRYEDSDPDAITLLAFSPSRWQQDLSAIARTGHARIYEIEADAVFRINGWFDLGPSSKSLDYFLEGGSDELKRREQQVRFVAKVMQYLIRKLDLDCAASCAMHYVREIPWMIATQRAGIPFIAVHKEFTVIDQRHLPDRIENWLARKFRFCGTHLCVTNETAKTLFSKSGVCEPENMTVTGLLRADNIVGSDSSYSNSPDSERPCVTLFSFGHLTGQFTEAEAPLDEQRSHYFAKWDHVGFVDLFRQTHVAFARMAIERPDVQFKIKPKNVEDWWIREIENVLVQDLGCGLNEIENCFVVDEPAPELIRNSHATICLNSTVVLESRVLGANTILPLFAEATDKYADRIYFDTFLDLFAVARSPDELADFVDRALRGERIVADLPERQRALCQQYLGNSDGLSSARVIDVIQDIKGRFALLPDGRCRSAGFSGASPPLASEQKIEI